MVEEFFELESEILRTYISLGEAYAEGDMERYNLLRSSLFSLLEEEKVFKDNAVLLVSMINRYSKDRDFNTTVVVQRIKLLLYKASQSQSDIDTITNAPMDDVTKLILLQIKDKCENTVDDAEKRELIKSYYLFIGVHPSLESEFVKDETLLSMRNANFVHVKRKYGELGLAAEEVIADVSTKTIISILCALIDMDSVSDFPGRYRLITYEAGLKAHLSVLPPVSFKLLKADILNNFLEDNKGNIHPLVYDVIKGVFESDVKDPGSSKVYKFPVGN